MSDEPDYTDRHVSTEERLQGLVRALDRGMSIRDALLHATGGSEFDADGLRRYAEQSGLIWEVDDEGNFEPTDAGRQWAVGGPGQFDSGVLDFCPAIDDLVGRQAMMASLDITFDGFRESIGFGAGGDFARDIIPEAYHPVIDEPFALRLFFALGALGARLSVGGRPGCMAEELLAIHLMGVAEGLLDMDLGSEAAKPIAREIGDSMFDLVLGDADALLLFEDSEPGDSALRNASELAAVLGMADMRPERWFDAMWGLPATGHLRHGPTEDAD